MNGSIGERLKYLRSHHNYTQNQLSEAIGCSVDSIKNFEKNCIPSTYYLISLAKIFEVSVDYLLGLNSSEGVNYNYILLDLAAEHVFQNNPDHQSAYYWIYYVDLPEGRIVKYQSEWAGFTNDNPPRDLRVPRKVIVSRAIEICKKRYGEPLIINHEAEVLVFELLGGIALIKADVFEKLFHELMKPSYNNEPINYNFNCK